TAMLEEYVEAAIDGLLDDDGGPLVLLAGDEVVDLTNLAGGATFTHVLTPADLDQSTLALEPDLLPLGRLPGPVNVYAVGMPRSIGQLSITEGEPGRIASFPPAALAGANPTGEPASSAAGSPATAAPAAAAPASPAAGAVLAVRVRPPDPAGRPDGGSAIDVELLAGPDAPAADDELVGWVRDAYEREVAPLGVPVFLEDVLARLLLDHPGSLERPAAPFGELLEAGGLEVRGDECADDESVWQNGRRMLRNHALAGLLEDPDDQARALEVLEVFDEEALDVRTRRAALEDLAHEQVLVASIAALLGQAERSSPAAEPGGGGREWEDALGRIGRVAQEMVQAARRPSDGAPARVVLAAVEEVRDDAEAAEAQLERAHDAEPALEIATDRLAWYASDRGDAARALRLLRESGARGDEPKLQLLRQYAGPPGAGGGGVPGRNDPCWCGSGRKFKQCHLGQPIVHPLPERFEWVQAKAIDFLERHTRLDHEEIVDLDDLALARTAGDGRPEAIDEALADPFLVDVALIEGRWLARFLGARGALVPEDELRLAQTWATTPRSLYEVLTAGDNPTPRASTGAGNGPDDPPPAAAGMHASLRDTRSGEVLEVRRSPPWSPPLDLVPGDLWCGRVVSDGAGRRLTGAPFRVSPAAQSALREVVDRADPLELAAWTGASPVPLRRQMAQRTAQTRGASRTSR
ncbi:MAG TPA: SEC-C domain-containing protein, partial [Acidimicrobiales bacterium]|nr:SEC-C domain-containing protein [Acidimicrobiales bacterium]